MKSLALVLGAGGLVLTWAGAAACWSESQTPRQWVGSYIIGGVVATAGVVLIAAAWWLL